MSHLSLSLIHGWLPAAVQAITAVVLVGAIGWRSRRWRVLWLPVLVASGAVLAAWRGGGGGAAVWPLRRAHHQPVGRLSPHRGQRLEPAHGPLPDQTNRVPAPVTHQTSARPITGIVVPIAIPANASKFAHRRELVDLAPTWFASNPPPR
jgi:hypothetical protein